MGGPSDEKAVSLSSGKTIIAHLDGTRYRPRSVIIDKTGTWQKKISRSKTDLVFNALHGTFGEDGKIQGYLDTMEMLYTGSGVLASALGMNKFISRQIFATNGLDVPKTKVVRDTDIDLDQMELPVIIKPNESGSSLGISIVSKREMLKIVIRQSIKKYGAILLEPVLVGREFSVAVLGNLEPKALPIIEITPKKGPLFDYHGKYKKNGAVEEVPAKIADVIRQNLETVAIKTHQLIGCRAYSRTDVILLSDNRIKVLEINTLPGLTSNSLLPKMAAAGGLSFSALLDRIIDYSLSK